MILDQQTLLSNAQAITATAPSTNVIDFGATGTVYGASGAMPRDLGKGEDMYFFVQILQAFNNLTSLQVDIQTSDDSTFATGVSTYTLGTYLLVALTAGKVLPWTELPNGLKGRYMRLYYTVVGTAPTTGTITSALTLGVQTNGVTF